ncbi:hypothetical protein H9Q13_12455 [Pontibacter sp. JH31]|uniref:Lipocalin-like domain-containing protein n=1 Tax=Pontibacter aquaedesilientis TaxID=2766980 RepID=A0ABR7XI64_9BACT|nr:hypothetical protein [Pontibacter aquaedesilientis]MBD1397980.1 hypothetical protein [Pontibacter aquaedesilientis]
MKSRIGLVVLAVSFVGLTAGCNKTDEDMQPMFEEMEIQQAVQGKWRIERVNNRLCRSGNCVSVVYYGTDDDYFEFKADSAFLQRRSTQSANSLYRDSFKADYTRLKGGFVLRNFGWSAQVRLMQRQGNKLVLESTYSGTEPSAVFTDTYFLYK